MRSWATPGLLVLDEATSAVDPETERALSGALLRAARGRTTISVAHRLSTAEAADLVLVFDAGLLVEQGSHTELVAARRCLRRPVHELDRQHASKRVNVIRVNS